MSETLPERHMRGGIEAEQKEGSGSSGRGPKRNRSGGRRRVAGGMDGW